MSAVAMADWYIATCVNAPSPVTSPTAQTPPVTRMWASVRIHRAVESSPTVSIPRPSRLALRPVATNSRSAVTASPVASVKVIPLPSSDAPTASAPTRTLTPSRSRTSATVCPASGSSSGSSRSSASTTVTATPKRAKTWPSSRPTAPPPRTINEAGRLSASMASWLVQYCTRSRPGIGGMEGEVPVAITIARDEAYVLPFTVTLPGSEITPRPRTKVPPLPTKRSTATLSSQLSVAWSRIRRATGPQSGLIETDPATPGMRRASASRSAARIIILLGTQPQYGHSPPTRDFSIPTTLNPAWANDPAASSPPGPMPITTTSTFSVIKIHVLRLTPTARVQVGPHTQIVTRGERRHCDWRHRSGADLVTPFGRWLVRLGSPARRFAAGAAEGPAALHNRRRLCRCGTGDRQARIPWALAVHRVPSPTSRWTRAAPGCGSCLSAQVYRRLGGETGPIFASSGVVTFPLGGLDGLDRVLVHAAGLHRGHVGGNVQRYQRRRTAHPDFPHRIPTVRRAAADNACCYRHLALPGELGLRHRSLSLPEDAPCRCEDCQVDDPDNGAVGRPGLDRRPVRARADPQDRLRRGYARPRLPADLRQARAGSGRRAHPPGQRSFWRGGPIGSDRGSRPASAGPDRCRIRARSCTLFTW